MKKHLLLLLTLGWVVFACEKDDPKSIAQLTTTGVTEITQTTAVAGGNVTHDGGASVAARGVCWSTGQSPTINDSKTSNGSGVGSFSSSITGLEPNTTYFVRAYATNSEGTSYGKAITFKTLEAIELPTLTTTEVAEITLTTAVSGGNISDDGGAPVTARGVCWSTNETPTIADSKTEDGEGIGDFTSSITELEAGTTYYVRAYATNSEGTSYGDEASFTTLDLPTLTTTEVTEITQNSAISGGNISDDGGAPVTARGVCWSTNETPTIADSKTEDGGGAGSFSSNITELETGSTYYIRAYATNSEGTSYGNAISFTTQQASAGSFIDSRDNNTYKFETIGNQVWMTENLKYLPRVDHPHVGSYFAPYYYVYGYDKKIVAEAKATENYNTYGVLYNWTAAMNSSESSDSNPSNVQGVCPEGWHLPSVAEWNELIDHLGGTEDAGGKLKETGTVHWLSPNTGAINESGFTALPAGRRYGERFVDIGYTTSFWSATENTLNTAKIICMSYNRSRASISFDGKLGANPVRCVRD